MTQFKVIQGKFHVKGYQPDGDSIRFAADNPAHWDTFPWKSANKKKAAKKQLRIEAIDALETHYEDYHQPRPFALAALERLLKLLGHSRRGGLPPRLCYKTVLETFDLTRLLSIRAVVTSTTTIELSRLVSC